MLKKLWFFHVFVLEYILIYCELSGDDMIITKTPFRMSFFGGGTDMKEFFTENGGAVLSTTFDKYCYVTVRHLPPFFDYKTELSYSKIERVSEPSELQHPAVRNAMEMLRMKDLRITYEADLPARSGLGTSSSFAVGMLNAFHALKGHRKDKRALADEAVYLERELCSEAGGWQDQIAASFGGFNKITFGPLCENGADGEYGYRYEVTPVQMSREKKAMLNRNLLMFFTGFTRFSSDVQKANADGTQDRVKKLQTMLSLVPEAEKVLKGKQEDLSDFGRLLDETWKLKRGTGRAVTTSGIDELYEKGIRAGALGGKLLGAGGGGFMVFYAEPERHAAVRKAMEGLMQIPFTFEEDGTQILYYAPEQYEV